MQNLDDFLDGYQAPVGEVAVVGRPALIVEHSAVESALAEANAMAGLGAGDTAGLLEQLATLEDEIEKSVMVFRLSAIGRDEWLALLAEHPPEKGSGLAWERDTFEPAALVASAIEPTVTHAQAAKLKATLPDSEWESLIAEIVRLNRDKLSTPKSRLLSVLRHQNDSSPGTWQDEGSLGAPSSAGNEGQ